MVANDLVNFCFLEVLFNYFEVNYLEVSTIKLCYTITVRILNFFCDDRGLVTTITFVPLGIFVSTNDERDGNAEIPWKPLSVVVITLVRVQKQFLILLYNFIRYVVVKIWLVNMIR